MIRFWTATDECGNSTETEQYVSLYDVTAPELTVPADFFVDSDSDDCSADITTAAAGVAAVGRLGILQGVADGARCGRLTEYIA